MRFSMDQVLVMCFLLGANWIALGGAHASSADAPKNVEPNSDMEFLEYLGKLERENGVWYGPEQMQSLDTDELLTEESAELKRAPEAEENP